MRAIISISRLRKTYGNGYRALDDFSLDIQPGEILALLGPNGAGKTTLISIICGIVNASSGQVLVDGRDNVRDYRETRKIIGLVPQELTLGAFDKVLQTLRFSRGLFGKKPDPDYLRGLLEDLSLWDKRNSPILSLSGGMKRRVLIAKALSHEPRILFLDEPTAGVDVELRKDMWALVRKLQHNGVTIILTTHYIEEAEGIADRVAIIDKGRLLLVDHKQQIMHRLGKKRLLIDLQQPLTAIPQALSGLPLELTDQGKRLVYTYDRLASRPGVASLLDELRNQGLRIQDLQTTQSSLEEIFVNLLEVEPCLPKE